MAVEINTSPAFQAGIPQRLFAIPNVGPWDVTSDGQRFLVAMPARQNSESPINVVVNWQAGLKR